MHTLTRRQTCPGCRISWGRVGLWGGFVRRSLRERRRQRKARCGGPETQMPTTRTKAWTASSPYACYTHTHPQAFHITSHHIAPGPTDIRLYNGSMQGSDVSTSYGPSKRCLEGPVQKRARPQVRGASDKRTHTRGRSLAEQVTSTDTDMYRYGCRGHGGEGNGAHGADVVSSNLKDAAAATAQISQR